ncbi:hypothetical protein EV361DRAFT_873272 [Lentinula raphanica]|nr:hypothetical protein EV361DRAFT_873272 [Lentinula raphanica]
MSLQSASAYRLANLYLQRKVPVAPAYSRIFRGPNLTTRSTGLTLVGLFTATSSSTHIATQLRCPKGVRFIAQNLYSKSLLQTHKYTYISSTTSYASHLSHAGSWSLEKSVTLGRMWFNSEKYRHQVFDQLGQTLASTAQTPWEHIDAAMRSLANSWHVFVNEDQVMQTFKTTPLMAEPRKYVTKHNDKTGNLALQIGDMALTFTVPRTRAKDTIPQLVFSGYVYFRDRATMEHAVSEIHATVLELYPTKGSDSEGNPWQIPKWFLDIVTKEGLKVMPKYGLAWIQASKTIELLSECNSGCIDYKGPIKAMTQQTLEGFESERSETVTVPSRGVHVIENEGIAKPVGVYLAPLSHLLQSILSYAIYYLYASQAA